MTTQILHVISHLYSAIYTSLSSKVAQSEFRYKWGWIVQWRRWSNFLPHSQMSLFVCFPLLLLSFSPPSFSNVSSRPLLLPSTPSLLLPLYSVPSLSSPLLFHSFPSCQSFSHFLLIIAFSSLFRSPPIILCDGFDSQRLSLTVKLNKMLHISPEIED